jgi:hypothetical protein
MIESSLVMVQPFLLSDWEATDSRINMFQVPWTFLSLIPVKNIIRDARLNHSQLVKDTGPWNGLKLVYTIKNPRYPSDVLAWYPVDECVNFSGWRAVAPRLLLDLVIFIFMFMFSFYHGDLPINHKKKNMGFNNQTDDQRVFCHQQVSPQPGLEEGALCKIVMPSMGQPGQPTSQGLFLYYMCFFLMNEYRPLMTIDSWIFEI